MNTPKTDRTVHPRGKCCDDSECESNLRNNYFIGKRLTADSFRVEQRYSLDRRRLLNRAIHGWGVVYGFGIAASPSGEDENTPVDTLTIGAGLALDECGRELLHTGTSLLLDNNLLVLDEKYKNIKPEDRPDVFARAGVEACWQLSVHYAERAIGPVQVKDSCYCDHEEWDRTCETVRFALRRVDCSECCKTPECDLNCGCAECCKEPEPPDRREGPGDPKHQFEDLNLEYRPREQNAEYRPELDDPEYIFGRRETDTRSTIDPRLETPPERAVPNKRGGCRCICDHLTGLQFTEECRLCEIEEECGSIKVDLRNGVPLACVHVVGEKRSWRFGRDIEDCGPRRLVKRNDLLFDLIRGCDLTQIVKIGWDPWHRKSDPIDFEEFLGGFGSNFDSDGNCITRAFRVKFSRKVRWDTVRRDCFVMTVVTDERDDGWWETLRVPIVRVEKEDADLIDEATIVVDGRWLREIAASGDPVQGTYSLFQDKITRVELEVRGDFIVDCNGLTVDANPRGWLATPSGNGTPGGSFLSTFLVGPAPPRSRPPASYSEDRIKGVS